MKTIAPEMGFAEAADIWLAYHCNFTDQTDVRLPGFLGATTEVSYRQYVNSLKLFFTDTPLNQIYYEDLRDYQVARVSGGKPFIRRRRPHEEPGPCAASPKKTNQELSLLKRIMLRARAWDTEIEDFYKPLEEEESDVQRALEVEEQDLWLRTAQKQQRWQLVYWYSLLGIGTTMSTNELRYQRLGDMNLFNRTVMVAAKGVKCKGRRRTIALVSAEELWAAERLLDRATVLGASAPQHYLLPFRVHRGLWDPTRPMSNSGLKREWNELRAETGLTWFRPYDLRHTGGTRLAEAGVSPAVIKARMGHLTQRMHDHYMHISEAAQRRSLEEANYRFGPQRVMASPPHRHVMHRH